MKNMKQGFTLVEIMIVVAIIAILAAVAIPNFIKYRDDARKQSCISNMHQLQTAAESWLTANPGTKAPTLTQLCGTEAGKYLKKTPTCPTDGAAYTISLTDGAIGVTCSHADKGHTLEATSGGGTGTGTGTDAGTTTP